MDGGVLPGRGRWRPAQILAELGDEGPLDVLPEPSFDRYARLVQEFIGVPIALVSIVESDRQIFPGAVGLPDPLVESRATPLSYSFCKHVVVGEEPVIIADARLDERVSGNPSIEELGVIGYAGFPLTDVTGNVVGSLCAIDTVTHDWTARELAVLGDLADACSTEITLRGFRRRAHEAAEDAHDVASRLRVLLALSERLASTRTKTDVSRALLRVGIEQLGCGNAGIWVVDSDDEQRLCFVRDPHVSWPAAEAFESVPLTRDNPWGRSVLDDDALFYESRAPQSHDFPTLVTNGLPESGHARVFLPLVVGGHRLGCLVMAWWDEREFSDDDQLTIAALTSATATALQRAWLLDDRATAAATLQSALLGELPNAPGVSFGACYRAARSRDQVGGDWYDALVADDGSFTASIGDVVGHDIAAAATMGQLRGMVRTIAWDRDESPARTVERVERAAAVLQPDTLATLVLVRADAPDATGDRRVRWTNAGHLAPLVSQPDGSWTSLVGGTVDVMLGAVQGWTRRDHEVVVRPGTTMLLFTDGLIETLEESLDDGRSRLIDVVEECRGDDLDQFVVRIADLMVGIHPHDDVALLAVRFD